MKNQIKKCQNCKKDFTIDSEDFNFYEKIKVPSPTFCPECRMKRRMIWRNERGLHKSTCALCNKNIISMYDPENKFKVFCDKCWWGDNWDPLNQSFSYNFKEPFFVQWFNLLKQIPLIQAWRFNNIDSDYMNYGTECKNCYLSASVTFCENISYSYSVDKSQDIIDSCFINKSSWCYENINSRNNYNSVFLENCNDCIDSSFLFDCNNCQNCFMSANLRNKKYVFRNRQYTKSEYESQMLKIKMGNYSIIQELLIEFSQKVKMNSIHKFANTINANQCSGDNIQNSRNSHVSFNINNSEDIKYSFRIVDSKDSMDLLGAIKTELAYDSAAPAFNGLDTQFCIMNRDSQDIKYSMLCSGSSHLFGCIGLRSKNYCIFNKQHTKGEYENLIPKIVKHMNDMPYIDKNGIIYKFGEFFPAELSPFCYNEAMIQEYFPLAKEDALIQGYKWKNGKEKKYNLDIKIGEIPEDIDKVEDEIVGKIIECGHNNCNEQCTKAFKIIKSELQFYRKMNLPLPHLCPNCRHYQRLSRMNPLKLWHRQCMCDKNNHFHGEGKCEIEFETSYAPDRPEIIYCEKCYQQEVY